MFQTFFTPTLMKGMKALVVILFLGSTPQAPEVMAQVHIYRGVDANNSGKAKLSPSQFRFNNDMSTFDVTATAKDCLYRFTVVGVQHTPPQAGDTGQIMGLPGYVATFDNNPLHHWSVSYPGTVNADGAKAAVALYAQANRGNIVNGTRTDCN